MFFLRIESYKKGIVFSLIFNIFSKLLFLLNSIVIAYYFGTQLKMDIYFYLLATIALLINFVASLNQSVLIPESMRISEQESPERAILFLNFFLYLYLLIALIVTVVLYLTPIGLFTAISNFNKSSLTQNVELLYFAIPLCPMMLLTTFLSDVLISFKYLFNVV